jgi:ATP-dependent RNA helicase DDX3X
MESIFNPFIDRYPNRRKIMIEKDKYSDHLIREFTSKKMKKNLESLSDKNKKLYLFINDKKLSDEETKFPEHFSDYGQIPKMIQNNLNEMELDTLTPIQKLVFGYLFNYGNKFFDKNNKNNNYDLVGCAQTGSGKTLAYLIPAISFLFNDPEGITKIIESKMFGYVSYPLILIILPTRELAIQTYEETLKLLYKTSINTVVVYGGEKYNNQIHELNEGCDIVIGTPGRLIDYLGRGFISLSNVKFLVIDEADKLLDMGFEEDINHILNDFQWQENCTTFLMSATFPKKVLNMVENVMKTNFRYITHGDYLGEKEEANENIKQRFYYLENSFNMFDKKLEALFKLLEVLDGKTLIFANKKGDVKEIAYRVEQYGYGIVCLIGDMDMNQRLKSLDLFKNGDVNLMVASDVASRGLDIPEISYVVNFDMPNNLDIYVHRIGRTGRVGNKGSSLTLLTEADRILFRPLFEMLSKAKQNIPSFLNYGYKFK